MSTRIRTVQVGWNPTAVIFHSYVMVAAILLGFNGHLWPGIYTLLGGLVFMMVVS